jgi:sugar phosphate isomerase/epimerase
MNRRQFVIKGGQAAALLALAPNLSFSNTLLSSDPVFLKFGIQLWTLRDVIYQNPMETIRHVGKMGYKNIESFEGEKGIFWGTNPKEFKSFLDDNDMTLIGSHCNWKEDLEKKAYAMANVGGKYLICPWLGPQKSIDDFKRFADEFNRAGEICKNAGIKFAYHNHDYSFKELDGKIPQQVMMDLTSPELVDFEMDMYWVVTAGIDPIEYLKKYNNRFKLCHIKDRIKDAKEPFASCTLGVGSIDYAELLPKVKELGMEYFIYEQEKYDEAGVLANADQSAKYLKQFTK